MKPASPAPLSSPRPAPVDNPEIAAAKRQARQEAKRRLAAVDFDRLAAAAQIFRNLERFPRFADARVLAVYLDFRNEAPIRPFLPRLFERPERVVAAPRCVGRGLEFYRLNAPEPFRAPQTDAPDFDSSNLAPSATVPLDAPFVDFDAFAPETAFRLPNLSSGAFGIWEPRPDPERLIPAADFDLVLVPGLAFDLDGGRLGRGAGFYDRFLATVSKKARLVGVALDEQIVEKTPRDAFDLPVDAVATPSRLLVFR